MSVKVLPHWGALPDQGPVPGRKAGKTGMVESEARAVRGGKPMMISAPAAPRLMAALVGIAVPFLVFGRAVTAVALILAVLGVFFLPHRRACLRALVRRARTPFGVMLGVTFALWLPSVAFSLDPLRSLEVWARMILFVGAAILIWAAFVEDDRMRALGLRALLVGTATVLVVSLVALYVAPELLSFVRAKGWQTADARLGLKGFASAAMLLIPVVLWSGSRLGGAWVYCAVAEAAGLLVIIGDTISRSAIAGLLAMMIVRGALVVIVRRQRALTVGAAVAVSAITIAVLVWLHDIRSFRIEADVENSALPVWLIDAPRQAIWRFTLERGMDAPWVGHGINTINFLPGVSDKKIPIWDISYIPSHPHNWVVEVFAESGVVGLTPLLVVVAMLLTRLTRDYVRSRDPAILTAMAVSIGYWVSGLFNFSFWSAWWQFSFVVLLALCLSDRHRRETGSRPPAKAPAQAPGRT